MIVIDPRLTETAKLADLHLQIRPGEDAALFAGMIRLVLERGWENREFCDRFVASLDGLRAAVADFPPSLVGERTGLAWKQIEPPTGMFPLARPATAAAGARPNIVRNSSLA